MPDHNSNQSKNAVLSDRARGVMPGGVSHEMRYWDPHPIYVAKASGAHKWDADGKRYIDYKMGSASVLLGHSHPDVVAAVTAQAAETPFTADCHALEIEWAEIVRDLFPSADLVRFTASGSEATMLAMRVGRAAAGRPKILRIDGHYHGWHDHAMKGAKPGQDKPASLGIPAAVSELIKIVPANTDAAIEAVQSDGEIGTIIVEASGANYGSVPLPPGFLQDLRRLADDKGLVLIFDEVITGFRWSPGGLQARDGVVPDITTLAKILTGGLPGGAVAGCREVMERLDPGLEEDGFSPPVSHKGTFNASPMIAAGAVAALQHVRTGDAQAKADQIAATLRAGLTGILDRLDIPGAVYGEASTFHLFLGQADGRSVANLSPAQIRSIPKPTLLGLRSGLLERGVDLMSQSSGVTSAAHDTGDVGETLQAFEDTFKDMKQNGLIPK